MSHKFPVHQFSGRDKNNPYARVEVRKYFIHHVQVPRNLARRYQRRSVRKNREATSERNYLRFDHRLSSLSETFELLIILLTGLGACIS